MHGQHIKILSNLPHQTFTNQSLNVCKLFIINVLARVLHLKKTSR